MAKQSQRGGASGRTRSEWEALIARYERSGLSRKRFCAEASVPVSSLDYWRSKLRQEARQAPSTLATTAKTKPGFIELPSIAAGPGWDMELELGGGVVLRLRRS
jgi:transposase-like protein